MGRDGMGLSHSNAWPGTASNNYEAATVELMRRELDITYNRTSLCHPLSAGPCNSGLVYRVRGMTDDNKKFLQYPHL
jgi:hypothetical protein